MGDQLVRNSFGPGVLDSPLRTSSTSTKIEASKMSVPDPQQKLKGAELMAARDKLQGKLCCVWIACESASCCDDGWIEFSGKTCCCVLDASIPAGKTPGIVCCGVTLCCANMPDPVE